MITKLIEIKRANKIVFVGDTHGDLEASQKVITDYLKENNKIVFLGDYVDRGPYSKENLDFLLKTKEKDPNQIFLLQGNHEGHRILPYSPADFWENLNKKEYQKYCSILEKLPLAIIIKKVRPRSDLGLTSPYSDIIALHGALPDIKNLGEINKVKLGSQEWEQIVWGDFAEKEGEYLGRDSFTGRPQFGRDWFFKLMKRFKKKVLIRAHDPRAPQFMFDDRCLTIFTSSAYTRERTIAILDFKKEIQTAKDLEIVKI